jgi:hypothetical protein
MAGPNRSELSSPTRKLAIISASELCGTAVNAALAAFVSVAQRELPDGVRAHVVAPGWVTESIPPDWDIPNSIPAAEVAATYRHALATPDASAVLTVP